MPLECALTVDVDASGARFVLAVANAGVEPVEVTFRDAGRADFAVRADGAERWRWREGRAFVQVVETVELAPGESFDVRAEWADPPPGEYEVVGELRADPTCRAVEPFEV